MFTRYDRADSQNIVALLALSAEVPAGALASPAFTRPTLLGRVANQHTRAVSRARGTGIVACSVGRETHGIRIGGAGRIGE